MNAGTITASLELDISNFSIDLKSVESDITQLTKSTAQAINHLTNDAASSVADLEKEYKGIEHFWEKAMDIKLKDAPDLLLNFSARDLLEVYKDCREIGNAWEFLAANARQLETSIETIVGYDGLFEDFANNLMFSMGFDRENLAYENMDGILSGRGQNILNDFRERIQIIEEPIELVARNIGLDNIYFGSDGTLMKELQQVVDEQFGKEVIDLDYLALKISGANFTVEPEPLDQEAQKIIETYREQLQAGMSYSDAQDFLVYNTGSGSNLSIPLTELFHQYFPKEGIETEVPVNLDYVLRDMKYDADQMPAVIDIPIASENFASNAKSAIESSDAHVKMQVVIDTPIISGGFTEEVHAAFEENGVNVAIPLEIAKDQLVGIAPETIAQFGLTGAEAGAQLAENAAEAMLTNISGITEAMSAIQTTVTNTFAVSNMEAVMTGMQLPLSYAAGIALGSGFVTSSASGMSIDALSAAQSGAAGASSIGSMISAGVASGIRAGQSGVVSAAVAVARAAVSAMQSELAIHSPSKVTEKMGEFFDEGFIRGVESMTPDIEDSIRAAVYVEPPAGVAYGAARESAPTVRVAGQAIDYDALADAMNARQVALYMNDRRMAQVMANETARAQSVRNRSIALGYGK